jgi:hypothetical protein
MNAFGPKNWTAKQNSSAVTSITTNAITTTSGSLLVAVLVCFTNKIGTTPMSDSKGNTWVAAVASTGTTEGYGAIFYVENCTGGASHTFTFTPTGSDFITIAVYEIAGAATSGALSNTNAASANSTTHSSGNITANATVPEIWIGGGAISHGVEGTPVITTGGTIFALPDGGTGEGLASNFQFADPSATGQFTFTTSSANPETSMIAGFKMAAAGGGGSGGAWAYA